MKKVQRMYRYILDKKSVKHICPKCGKKRFVKYIDSQTDEYLSDKVGRCDREVNCAYHYPPKQFFDEKEQTYQPIIKSKILKSEVRLKMSLHTQQELKNTLVNYNRNNFIQFLQSQFDNEAIKRMLNDYKIGTATYWYDSTVFWQIDQHQKIRGGKIIKYFNNGKRTKYINWVHAYKLKHGLIESFNLNQCLFGLNLIDKYPKSIAIVESEKTACIMSLLFDKYLWLATGSLKGLTLEKIDCIKDKKIILYPDLGAIGQTASPYEQWKLKCIAFKKMGFDIELSDLLERKATLLHREKGYDLADYFLENLNKKPRKILSEKHQIYINMYMKNQNFKTLIDVFDLQDESGNRINL